MQNEKSYFDAIKQDGSVYDESFKKKAGPGRIVGGAGPPMAPPMANNEIFVTADNIRGRKCLSSSNDYARKTSPSKNSSCSLQISREDLLRLRLTPHSG